MESLNNSLEIGKNININNEIREKQESFIETNLGKAINTAMDIGIKAVLPDFIEDQIIQIKDAILEQGFKEGIKEVIRSTIEIGKSVTGIFTGNFENITQVQNAVKNGGILDSVSKLLDFSIKLAKEKNLINSTVASMIKQGKNTIISSVSNRIEETLTRQLKAVEKLDLYCGKWNEQYINKDFSKMETSYKNIEKYLDIVMPFEKTINKAREIENIHNLIKNNGHNFELTEDELKVAQKLAI